MIRVDGYFGDASRFLDVVKKVCDLLKDGLDLCKWVGRMIPEVGPIIARAASYIENLHITQTIGDAAKAIEDAINNVSDWYPNCSR